MRLVLSMMETLATAPPGAGSVVDLEVNTMFELIPPELF